MPPKKAVKAKGKPKQKKAKPKKPKKKPVRKAKAAKQKPEPKIKFPESFTIGIDTLNRSKCLKNGSVKRFLGAGSFGEVFQYCDEKEAKHCKYVLKVQFLAPSEGGAFGRTDLYINEVFYHSLMQDFSTGIVPRLRDHWICPKSSIPGMDPAIAKVTFGIGCMLIDRWEGSLHDIQFDVTDDEIAAISRQFQSWLPILTDLQIRHNDLERQAFKNMLYRGRGPNIQISINDWSHAEFDPDKQRVHQYYKDLFEFMPKFMANELRQDPDAYR